jgi:citrate synthase
MAQLTASQTAARLGVKQSTVYAYVSRGLLRSTAATDGTSRFDSRQVEQLAQRGRPRLSSQEVSINLLIETGLTSLSETRVRYRGHPVDELAHTHTFEDVAELLWTGSLPDVEAVGRWRPWVGPTCKLPAGLPMDQQIRICVASMPTTSTGWSAPDRATVRLEGQAIISGTVDSLEALGPLTKRQLTLGQRRVSGSIAARLWPRLSAEPPSADMLRVLNAALVLLADHELATSALAVRVAASTLAAPGPAIGAGLGAMQGPLHGGASRLALELLDAALAIGASASIRLVLADNRHLPGFGHRVYTGMDPRATVLLSLLAQAFPRSRALTAAEELIEVAGVRTGLGANIDLALATFERAAHLAPRSAETIFTIARIAGWIGHVLEEYQQPPLRFRVRASYTGAADR